MFGTYFGYELVKQGKRDLRDLGALALIILVLGGIHALKVPMLAAIALPLMAMITFCIPIVILVEAAIDYWQELYGERGYFTMTLPIKGHTIFAVKILRAIIAGIYSTAVAILLGLFDAWAFATNRGVEVSTIITTVVDSLTDAGTLPLSLAILLAFIWLVCMVITMSAAMTIGAQARWNHLGAGAAFIAIIAAYIANQLVISLASFFIPMNINMTTREFRLDSIFMMTVGPGASGLGEGSWMPLGLFIVLPLWTLFMALWGARTINRKTSLR
ncbi:hypothetical protein G7Y41_07270 [Schaalia sp. ZJ405]|uniref:hypothetical protein n=1 Tax=Schaalia sp. ZJ405 TaxID=2709403 RepID=UPI0013ECC5BB|nr:hypothetical protein [Schaalia sp. ZJ405]QPK80851.1 hypothetical protein G7Y41_07270 [Schaalia sp. ZJ405]